MDMIGNRRGDTVFREGDEVVLAEGTYQGTPGVFVRFRKDAAWADIRERNGSIRSHPVAWLAHPGDARRPMELPSSAPEAPTRPEAQSRKWEANRAS
jgi:hypothetical protein